MQRMLLLIVVLLFSGLAMAQDWQVVKEGTMEHKPKNGFFMNADTGLYVGSDGVVVRTTDGGLSGETVREPDSSGISWYDVEFTNDLIGFACGSKGFIYKTLDGGLNWTQVGDTANYTSTLYGVSVVNENIVYVSGSSALMLKSIDGGENWTKSDYDFQGQGLDGGVAFSDENVGVTVSKGSGANTWYTYDGGTTWTPVILVFPPGTSSTKLYAVDAAIDSTILVVGYNYCKFLSTDGGKTYTVSGDYTGENRYIANVDVINENIFAVIGTNGHAELTVDGGNNWSQIDFPTGQSPLFIDFVDENIGYIFSNYGHWFKTQNGGQTWDPLLEWPHVRFESIAFPDDDKIVLTAWGGGEMAMSNDGGYTWSYPNNIATEYGSNIWECEFSDVNNGIFGSASGYLSWTENGGQTWTFADNPMYTESKVVYALHYVSNDLVFAGGSSGYIIKSEDAGKTWTKIGNEGGKTVYDIWPVSSKQILATASSGQIYTSNAALDSFSLAFDYGSKSMRAVEFRGDIGIVVADGGLIYRTTVSEWDTLYEVDGDPDGDNLYDLEFVTDSLVFAAGENGKILKSEDAGLTWTVEMSPTTEFLRKIRFRNNKLWAVGSNGVVILKDLTPPAPISGLVINEFMASNDGSFLDEFGGDDDWIEIYNMNDHPVDIGGLYLTDDLEEPAMWQVPTTAPDSTTIPAGGFLVLWADKESEQGILHLELKLSGDGEQVGLVEDFMGDTLFIDSLTFGPQWADTSYGYVQDGGGDRAYFQPATPGESNSGGVIVVGIEEDSNPVIAEYHLAQNYPNPFNPLTTIEFSIKQTGKTTLVIYSVTGQKIKTLLDKNMKAGSAKISFDASRLASGVYFYELKSGKFSSVKKMLLMK